MDKRCGSTILHFCCMLVVVGILAPDCSAQVLYGSLVGNVTDAGGAAVPAAAVRILQKETNEERRTVTNDVGAYVFPALISGTYDVTVSKEGFTALTRGSVAVSINVISRVDVVLEIGPVQQSVIVSGEVRDLQTDRAEVRSDVGTAELANLPVSGFRNYQDFYRTLPGFSTGSLALNVVSNPGRSMAYNINGTSLSSNVTKIDGVSATKVNFPSATQYVPSLESIEMVNIVTASFDAEQGLAGGAAITVQTKSGTNQVHGSFFEYHQDQHLKAKAFFLPAGERNPKQVANQYGATLGGPFKKDRLFYFVSWEGTRQRQALQQFATVPTAAIKSGDMSQNPQPIYDPQTGDGAGGNRVAFPDNQIPQLRINPISRMLDQMTPLPNLGGLVNNYFTTGVFSFDRDTLDAKFNWNPRPKATMFSRFGFLHYRTRTGNVFGDQLGGSGVTGINPGIAHGTTWNMAIGATYTFTPHLIADAYFGYMMTDTNVDQLRIGENVGLDVLGIPGTNGTRRFESGFPTFQVTNYSCRGICSSTVPFYHHDPQYQYVANLSWIRGTHNVRLGFDLHRETLNHTHPQPRGSSYGVQGGFTFGGGPTALRGGAAPNQFNSYATFLLGLPTQLGKTDQVPDVYDMRIWLQGYYIRDQWNLTPKITFSYGLRWGYMPFPDRRERGLEEYLPETGQLLVCGVGVAPRDCGIPNNKRMFEPRVGIAYRLGLNFVLRAGYGITYDPYTLPEVLRANYPVLIPKVIDAPNTFSVAGNLTSGIPRNTAPAYGNGIIDMPGNVVFTGLSQHFRRGYIQSANFSVQKRLRYGFTGQVAYVATRHVHKMGGINVNAGQIIGAGAAGRPLNQLFGRTADTIFYGPAGTGQYNSLQATLERRFSRGLQLAVNYTWGKAIGPNDNNESQPKVQALAYYGLNRAVSGYDRTQLLHITNVWTIPFGRGQRWERKGRILTGLLGGWQVNSILSLMSGLPYSVSDAGISLNLPGSTQRADQVKAAVQKLGNIGLGASYFDPLAFATVTQPRFGTAGFNALRGPGIVNLDLGVFREFAFRERWKFRAEAFNSTNTPHFANPGSNVSSMILRPDGSILNLGGFSSITSTSNTGREGVDERQFRLGLRLSF